jgi:hypothetical protein
MRTFLFRTFILGFALAATSCGTHASGEPRPRMDRNLITQEQMRDGGFNNAFDAVQALRPNWLTTRGTDSFRSPGQVQVYVNDTRMGGVNTLREFGVGEVTYIRYFDGVDATARWGLDHGHGAIYVSTRPG